jgi:hypothetical protein
MKPNGQPEWVCDLCGTTYGNWYITGSYTGPPHWCATFHVGECEVCLKENTPVTQPRDYGGLRKPMNYIKRRPKKKE